MKVSRIVIGPLQSNCYLIKNDKDEYLLIDPGEDYDSIRKFIFNKKIVGVIITHSHYDHMASAKSLEDDYNLKLYSFANLKEGMNKIGNFIFEVIYTLGHTMDCISIYFSKDKIMFTGDFLFKGSVGRWDFPESNYGAMLKSIKKIKDYPRDIVIYPGHGNHTTIGDELLSNPFLS